MAVLEHFTIPSFIDLSIAKKLHTCEKSTSTSDAIKNINVSGTLVGYKIRTKTSGTVYLCVVRVSRRNTILIFAVLDQGSTHTFCDKNLVKILNLSGPETSVQIKTIIGSSKVYNNVQQYLPLITISRLL